MDWWAAVGHSFPLSLCHSLEQESLHLIAKLQQLLGASFYNTSITPYRAIALDSLLNLLQQHLQHPHHTNHVSWKLNSDGQFSVRSLYLHLHCRRPIDLVMQTLWSACAPLKVKLTMWVAAQGRLLTANVISRRHMSDSFHYPLCLGPQDTITLIHWVVKRSGDHSWSIYTSPNFPLHLKPTGTIGGEPIVTPKLTGGVVTLLSRRWHPVPLAWDER